MRGVTVRPSDGARVAVLPPDVSNDLPREISGRSEDPACNHVAVDFGEPDFDLVQPRGVGGREVQSDPGRFIQEALHGGRLVSRRLSRMT